MTFQDLVNAAPLISEKATKVEGVLAIFGIAFALGTMLYIVYFVFEYIYNEHKRRKTAPWIPIMKARTDGDLEKDLKKLRNDSRLPNSYLSTKTESLTEQYDMVNDFMRICYKRKIKELK